MKIALVVPGGVDRSGTERVIPFLLWLIERLARTHELHVFALRQEPRPGRWKLLGADVHNIGAKPRRVRAVAALLAEHRRAPFDVVHAHWAIPQGVVGAAAAALLRRPLVLGLAGGELESMPERSFGGMRNRRGRAWLGLAMRAAGRIVVPGPALAEAARRLGFEADVVRLGVALDRWPPRPPRAREPGAPLRLLQIADLSLVKDQETLLRAAADLAGHGVDFTLDVAGTDTLGGRVQAHARTLGLADRVRFHGALPHARLRPIVEQSDLLLVTSRFEAGPVAPLEAAVAGVPTVGTAVGYVREWGGHASAVAVPIGDAEALAREVGRLAADEDGRLALAHAAQRAALAYDADTMAAGFEGVYRSAAEAYATRGIEVHA